jgi:hypothetical protein
MTAMLMKNVNGVNVPLDEADLAQREADVQLMPALPMPTITARQLRLALLGLGLTGAQVEAQIAAMPGSDTTREAARIEWEYATSYQRDHQLVAMLGAALNLTEAQIDNAWRGASFL